MNRRLHHLGVKLEPHRGDLPRLLIAKQIAGAADFEIVQRQLEAAAQAVDLLQCAQAPLGVGRDGMLAGNQ